VQHLEIYGSFVHVERLTLRSGLRALRFQTAGAEGNVVRGIRVQDVTSASARAPASATSTSATTTVAGRLVWPQVYEDDGGAHSDDDGIRVEGSGHVVCHNRVAGFGDAMKNAETGARANDFYGNEVVSAYDNGLELDGGAGNLRALRNRFTNTYATLSFQPIFGGPAYAIRNVVVNVAHEQLKLHGLGSGEEPSGIFILHNTFVSPEMALRLETSATTRHLRCSGTCSSGRRASRCARGRLDGSDRGRSPRLRRLLPEWSIPLQPAAERSGELRERGRHAGGRARGARRRAGGADLRERSRRAAAYTVTMSPRTSPPLQRAWASMRAAFFPT
jgi:hypothetical protein